MRKFPIILCKHRNVKLIVPVSPQQRYRLIQHEHFLAAAAPLLAAQHSEKLIQGSVCLKSPAIHSSSDSPHIFISFQYPMTTRFSTVDCCRPLLCFTCKLQSAAREETSGNIYSSLQTDTGKTHNLDDYHFIIITLHYIHYTTLIHFVLCDTYCVENLKRLKLEQRISVRSG